MSDPSFLTYEFSKSLPQPQLLTQIGQGMRGLQQQDQTRQLEGQYNEALNRALLDPTNQNISSLYQVAEPLGRFPNARAAINDLFARMPPEQAAAMAQDPNMVAYQQAMEAWQQNPLDPNLRMALQNTSNPVGLFDETQEIIAGRTEELTQEQLKEAERAAESAYFENPSRENRRAWYDAAEANGTFEEVRNTIGDLTEEQRLETVKEGLNIFGPLAHGAPDLALDQINRLIRGNDDEDEIAALEQIKGLIEDGRIQEAMGVLGTTLGAFEEGQAGMDTALAMAANKRQGEAHVSDMINRAINTEIADEEMRERLQEVWKDSPVVDFGLGSVLIDMAQVFEDDGLSADQKLTATMALRNQYLKETDEWQGINESNAKVRQAALRAMLVSGMGLDDEAIGAADLALVNSFQRLIDPATVRESDITNMRATIGGFDQVEQWVNNFRTGAKFNPQQRKTIMQVASQLSGVYSDIESRARDFVDTYAPRLGETTQDVIGDIVFDPYDEEQQLQEFKDVMIWTDPQDSERIRPIESLDELKRQYPRAYGYLSEDTVVGTDDEDGWGDGWSN